VNGPWVLRSTLFALPFLNIIKHKPVCALQSHHRITEFILPTIVSCVLSTSTYIIGQAF